MGLSYPDSQDEAPTLFDYMMEQNLVESKLFSFYLDRNPKSTESLIMFGGYDTDLMKTQPNFHNVSE